MSDAGPLKVLVVEAESLVALDIENMLEEIGCQVVASVPRLAVAERRVYAAPTVPWGWLGEPPSINRLIGLRWLLAVLYRTEPRIDVPAEAKAFHRLFYGVAPSDAELSGLLEGAL